VASLVDFEEVAGWKARAPDEVDLIEPTFDDYAGVLRPHSFYVRSACRSWWRPSTSSSWPDREGRRAATFVRIWS
jgi:hypothetical protein